MMKRVLLSAATAAFILSGCVTSPVPALVQNDVRFPGEVVSNNVPMMKEGRASCSSILGLYSSGDCSVEAAARNGGITRIHSYDYIVDDYIVYGTLTTVVYGTSAPAKRSRR